MALHASQTHDANGPTLPEAVRLGGENDGGITFLRADGSEIFYSFAQVAYEVDRRAAQLLESGLRKGDRVGFVLTENHEFVFSFLAALTVGVAPVPMYPPLSLGKLDSYLETAARILTTARARALLTDKRAQSVLWSVLNKVDGLESLLCVEDLPKVSDERKPDISHIDLDDVAFVQFTSGSTSLPKGVVVTHRSLLANLHVIMKYGLEISPDDIAVSWLPLYHDMGLIGFMLAPIWYSVPTIYLPTLTFVKRPTLWMETMSRFRGTISFAPNFAYALATRRTTDAKLKKLDLSCVKALGCGAEPNHPETLRAFAKHFATAGLKPTALLPCYGMAEATLAITFSKLTDKLRTQTIDSNLYHDRGIATPATEGAVEFVSCGRALPGHEVEIVDENGDRVPEAVTGEVIFRGPSLAAGYQDNEEATRDAFTQKGLYTGDLGYLVDGELFVTGRKKDIIILNGRNYDPQTIEWAAAEVEGIRKGNVVAFSRPSDTTEELIVVAEARAPETNGLGETVKNAIQEKLFLAPSEVVLLKPGQLPKTSSGKLQRRLARQQYLSGVLGTEVRTLGIRGEALKLAKHLSLSLVARIRHKVKRRATQLLNSPIINRN